MMRGPEVASHAERLRRLHPGCLCVPPALPDGACMLLRVADNRAQCVSHYALPGFLHRNDVGERQGSLLRPGLPVREVGVITSTVNSKNSVANSGVLVAVGCIAVRCLGLTGYLPCFSVQRTRNKIIAMTMMAAM
jgi:hypothetical protein